MDKFDALRTALTTDAAFRTVAVGLVCVAAIVVVWSQSRSTVMSMVVTVAITGVGQVPMRAAFAAVQAKLDGQTVTSAPCTDVTAILATIRQLESGGNYQAEAKGASASGAYQFVDGTWAGFGGFGHAANAPPSVQDAKAGEMVTAILATQPVEQVPLVWYTGHPVSDPTELDTVPRPDAGNKLTPRQYRAKWLTEYTRQAASCVSPRKASGKVAAVDRAELVSVGQGDHALISDAAAGFSAWESAYGGPIPLTTTHRTRDQQADCHRRKPTLCLDPKKYVSWHMAGRAVDVDMSRVDEARLLAAANATGWCQSAVGKGEPWHFSFNGCG